MKLIKIEKSTNDIFFIIYGIIILILIAAARLYEMTGIHQQCFFKSITGIPCLTCGTSRMLISIGHFNLINALFYNPLIFIIIMIIFLLMCITIITYLFHLPHYRILLSKKEKRILVALAISAVILNWAYLIIAKI